MKLVGSNLIVQMSSVPLHHVPSEWAAVTVIIPEPKRTAPAHSRAKLLGKLNHEQL